MVEKVSEYKLTKHELSIETGEHADQEEVKRQADLISNKWKANPVKLNNPLLLLLGGFQGSGKTTLLESLAPELNLLIISPDEIRHNLFSQQYPFSEDFTRLVNATKFELIKRALASGSSTVVDQSLTPDRVKLSKEIASQSPSYQVVSVFLDAPEDVLRKRVTERPNLQGRYKGTLGELEASIRKYKQVYGEVSLNEYDLIIDSSQNDSSSLVNLIKSKL